MTDLTIQAPFPSLAALKAAHAELLRRVREAGETPALLAEIEGAIRRGSATGALLDSEDERWQAQNILDYWGTRVYRPGHDGPDATLVEFDPEQAPELDDALCPYLGLDAFGEARSEVFFGRDRLIGEIKAKLAGEPLVAVLGPSGSGKSSVVRAGLLPALKQGGLPGSAAWHYLPIIVPGPQPLASLARLLGAADPAAEAEGFRDKRRLREEAARRFSQSVVVVVDQFEELFTLCNDDEARRAFVENLVVLATDANRAHRVILTMRTDFEPLIGRIPDFQPLFEQAVIRVTPLTAAELREAITRPADRIGLKFEDGLVDALLHDILGEPAALPLLQFTLLKLWERRDRNRVTWEAYKALGGGRQALARAADEFYNGLIPEEQTTARRLLLRLVRPGEGTEVTSNRLRRASLYHKSDAVDRVDRVLEKLVRARLLRLTEPEAPRSPQASGADSGPGTASGAGGPDAQVEVAHEALVRNWPTLVSWLDDERAALRQRQRLTTAAEQWVRLGRDPGAVWRGLMLDEAARYEDLSDLEAEFVQAGRAAEEAAQAEKRRAEEKAHEAEMARQIAEVEKRRAEEQARSARRNRRLFQVAGAAFLIALALGGLAVYFGSQARRSADQAEAANTQSALNLQAARTQEAAARIAEAGAVDAAATAEAAKAQAVNAAATADANRLRAEAAQREARARLLTAQGLALFEDQPLLGLRLTLEGLALIPAGEAGLRASFADAVRQLLAQGRIAKLGGDIHSLYPSPDAALLILDRQDRPGEVVQTADGRRLYDLRDDLSETHWAITFSPVGAVFTAIYTDTSGELRRAAGGEVLAALEPGLTTVDFSPDADASLLIARYPGQAAAAETLRLYRAADGAEVAADKAIVDVRFSEGEAAYFAVRYADRTAEVRRTGDGGVVFQPAGQVDEIVFSRDDAVTYFAVLYRNGRAELRQTARPLAVVKPFTGSIDSAAFPDRAARYILLSYGDGSGELRQIADEAVVFRLEDRVRDLVFSPEGTYFGVVYFSGQAELRRTDNRRRIAQFTADTYEYMEYPDPGERYVLLYNEFGRQELRRTANGSLVQLNEAAQTPARTAAGPPATADYYSYRITFSSDPQARYFTVGYANGSAELRRTETGAVAPLDGTPQDVSFANDLNGEYALVTYASAPAALYRLDEAGPVRLAALNGTAGDFGPLNFSADAAATYFTVTYNTAQAELWTTRGGPRRLAPLGLAAFNQWFDLAGERLVVWYYDDRVFLLDLNLLDRLDGQADALSPPDLLALGCETLARHQFDEAQLRDYLGEAGPQACR